MVRDKLVDDESRIIYDARQNYKKNKDIVEFWSQISAIKKEWRNSGFYVEKIKEKIALGRKKVVLYGAGQNGFWTKNCLEINGIEVLCFCDKNVSLVGQTFCGVKIISQDELMKKNKDAIVVITSKKFSDEIYKELVDNEFYADSIITPKYGKIIASNGKQYFDYFKPVDNEVFIDAGAYDGKTTMDFFEWAKSENAFSYVMEPFEDSKELIERNLIDKNVQIVYAAAWDKDEKIKFGGSQRDAKVGEGTADISAMKIDSMVNGEKVTYIKMDIEGSELNALKGASETIKRNRPKLAICIYHKPEDIDEIPEYLEELVPEYKFAIRHYTTCLWETVLYAWV